MPQVSAVSAVPSGDAKQYKVAVNVTGLVESFLSDNTEAFLSMFRKNPKQTYKFLDIGCGDGFATIRIIEYLTELCKKANPTIDDPKIEVTAVDFSESMVAATRAKNIPGVVEVVQADAANLPTHLKQGQFDGAFSMSTWHWIRDTNGLINGLSEALTPSGRIFSEFAFESPPEIRRAITKVMGEVFDKDMELRATRSDPWNRTMATQWQEALARNGFNPDATKIDPKDRSQPLTGENGIIEWLKMFAKPFISGISTAIGESKTPLYKRNALLTCVDDFFEIVADELKKPQYRLYDKCNVEDPWHVLYKRFSLNAEKQHSR